MTALCKCYMLNNSIHLCWDMYISNHFFLKLAFLYSFSTYIRLVWFFFATYKNYFTVRKLPLFVTVLGSGSSATANVCEVSEPRAESWLWCREQGKTAFKSRISTFSPSKASTLIRSGTPKLLLLKKRSGTPSSLF